MQSGKNSLNPKHMGIFPWWGLFAVLLGIVTYKHEMYLDEVQPWLWVRYEHNLLHAIQHLRYESHPALWTILIYAVSRISSNVLMMQWMNYLLGVACAYLVLSKRSVPLLIRVLSVFGISFFFVAGALARNYMLPTLLLIAGARCITAERKRHWLAMALFALAINAHFLAIPVVAAMCVWLYWLEPEMTASAAIGKLKNRDFWISLFAISVAVILCYVTVRPAGDVEPPGGGSLLQYFVVGTGRIWHYFVPITIDTTTATNGNLVFADYLNLFYTLLLFTISIAVLPSRRSRYFMITASALWCIAASLTLRNPLETHCTLLITSYIIALFIRGPQDGVGSWLPDYAAQPVLVTLLSMQVLICAQFSIKELEGPFSAGKPVAQFLKSAGLAAHPLVAQPEISAPTVMAYNDVRSVYFPGCSCSRPYVLYKRGWASERAVTLDELNVLKSSTGSTPVLISKWALSEADQKRMGLRFIFKSPEGWAFVNEDVYVYVADAPIE